MSWRPAPSVLTLLHDADRLAPHRNKSSDGIIGDAAHAASASDHNPDSRGIVHAVDLTEDPAGGWDCALRTGQIRDSRDRRVLYVIFDHRWFHGDRGAQWGHTPWAWEPYHGSSPHTEHMHVSVEYGEALENDVRPWFAQAERDWFDMASLADLETAVNKALDARGLTAQTVKDLETAARAIRYGDGTPTDPHGMWAAVKKILADVGR